ncbi:NfeD family protein [Fusobacterium gastrosuis]|uniref:NfeD family protein n=1 Tax=Fusobacterium gastrosuis TaxID=1755100 RepID=UPI002977558A|nr:NfeD family protein [Fusobacteriaceae bacterium]MDY5714211.1 NfeD family protein [Fusobacterium gastrosuis]
MGVMLWLSLTFIFVILEIFIPSLITIWFALAAILTVPITFFFENSKIEILFFFVLSVCFIIFTRPYAKKFLLKNKENFDSSMVGCKVQILNIIRSENNEKIYEVKFKGAIWTALSNDLFSIGENAIITEFKGNKIIIKK